MNIFDKLGLENKPPIVTEASITKYKLKQPLERADVVMVGPQVVKRTDTRAENMNNPLLQNIEEMSKRFSGVSKKPTLEVAQVTDKPPQKLVKKSIKLTNKLAMREEEGDFEAKKDDMSVAVKEMEQLVAAPTKTTEPREPKKPKVYLKASEKERFATLIGETPLKKRIVTNVSHINLKAPNYYMNNRTVFINAINKLFEPYKEELEANESSITCDNIGSSAGNFDLLLHQKIVRDYLNLYTPYRGLLLYHGLGSGKTCTSIAIAEGFKSKKKVIIMTPASLHANYAEQLKQCGDYLYKKNQFWEWIPTHSDPKIEQTLATELSLDITYIQQKGGAWFVNVRKPTNYESLSVKDKTSLTDQINLMISSKYHFINYNGLSASSVEILTENYTKNIFDDAIVIIDEAHNFIGRIVNKMNKLFKNKPAGKSIDEDAPEYNLFDRKATDRGQKAPLPIRYPHMSLRLYEYLLLAKNARVVLLTGTPIINYPNEIAILFNILRGYIKSYSLPLVIDTQKAVNADSIKHMLSGEHNIDYIEYSKNILTIHRNPLGFVNVNAPPQRSGESPPYYGVELAENSPQESVRFAGTLSDAQFIENIKQILKVHGITANLDNIKVKYHKALPDKSYDFNDWFMANMTEVKHMQEFQNRIIGLTSYFRSAQEELMPRYNPNFNPILIEMSDHQYELYEDIRAEERETERNAKIKAAMSTLSEETSKTFKIFSRMCCNFVPPAPLVRPHPMFGKPRASAVATPLAPVQKQTYQEREQILLKKTEEKEEKAQEKINKTRLKQLKEEEKEDRKKLKEIEKNIKKQEKDEEIAMILAKEKVKTKEAKVVAPLEVAPLEVAPSKPEKEPKKKKVAKTREEQDAEIAEILSKEKAKTSASTKKKTKKATPPLETSTTTKKKTRKASPPKEGVEGIDDLIKTSEEVLDLLGGAGSDVEEKEEEEEDYGAISANPLQIAEIEEIVNAKEMLGDDMHEEVEAEDSLNQIGDASYVDAVQRLLNELDVNKNMYLGPEQLHTCSPKFAKMIENIMNPDNIGLHLVYSQFRTLEGIGIFALALEAHGFSRFKIKRQGLTWDTDMTDDEWARPHYALYTGTEDKKEKDIIRAIYNGDWKDIPGEISKKLKKKNHNNNVGEIIKVFMITASGSEGINLRNTRFVHIMEPYWNPVRSEQVIGRARRICSHQGLPEELRTVEVFLYLMVFSQRQKDDATPSLKHDDVSLLDKKVLFTTEQTLHELSTIKKRVNDQLLMSVKATSIDCATFSKGNSASGIRCLVYDRPSTDEIIYHPNIENDARGDVAHEKQALSKLKLTWTGQTVTIRGKQYINKMDTNEMYDFDSYNKYQETMKSGNPDLSIELKLSGYWVNHGDGTGHLEPARD